jgi:glucokinase
MDNYVQPVYVTCADIGGSHITVAVIDLLKKSVVPDTFVRMDVDRKGNCTAILSTWVQAIKQSGEHAPLGVACVAMAMPGPFDYDNGISYITGLDKYESLYGRNIKSFIAEELGIPSGNVKFRNDAEAMIMGEVLAGSGLGFDNVMGVTLGTGFGSAHYIDGHSKDLNLGSELFKNSIADDYLSTRWFLKRYFDLTGLSTVGVQELARLADTSGVARNVFKDFAYNLNDFLTDHVKRLNPDALLLCGNIARSSALFLRHLAPGLRSKIVLAKLGEHAALFGAAGLFESPVKRIA